MDSISKRHLFSKEDVQMSMSGKMFSHGNHWENEIKTIVGHHVPPSKNGCCKDKGYMLLASRKRKGNPDILLLGMHISADCGGQYGGSFNSDGEKYHRTILSLLSAKRKSVCQRGVCILGFLVVLFIIARYRITVCGHQLSKYRKCRPHTYSGILPVSPLP